MFPHAFEHGGPQLQLTAHNATCSGDSEYLCQNLPLLGKVPSVDDLQQLLSQPVMLPSRMLACEGCLHVAAATLSSLAAMVELVLDSQQSYITATVSPVLQGFLCARRLLRACVSRTAFGPHDRRGLRCKWLAQL
jgi:hypothetical protein